MTYPPQQPGPYGQQPGPYGQFGPQQPGPYGHFGQPGYQGGEPPPTKRTGLIVAIVVIAVLVLGGGIGVYFLTRDDDDKGSSASGNQTSEPQRSDPTSERSRPRSTSSRPTGGDTGGSEQDLKKGANDYVNAINGSDKAKATELTCDKTGPGMVYEGLAGQADTLEVSDIHMFKNNTEASVNIKRTKGTVKVPTAFTFKGGAWCVSR